MLISLLYLNIKIETTAELAVRVHKLTSLPVRSPCCALTASQRALRNVCHGDGGRLAEALLLLVPAALLPALLPAVLPTDLAAGRIAVPPPAAAAAVRSVLAFRGLPLLPGGLLDASAAAAVLSICFLRPGLPLALLSAAPFAACCPEAAFGFLEAALPAADLPVFVFAADADLGVFGLADFVDALLADSAGVAPPPAAFAALAAFLAAFLASRSTAVCRSSSSGATACPEDETTCFDRRCDNMFCVEVLTAHGMVEEKMHHHRCARENSTDISI